jgi:hypothetical protein
MRVRLCSDTKKFSAPASDHLGATMMRHEKFTKSKPLRPKEQHLESINLFISGRLPCSKSGDPGVIRLDACDIG